MLFPNGLAENEIKMLTRISLRDVVSERNKYLNVMSNAFLLQNNVFKGTVSVWQYALQLLQKKILWAKW